VKLDRIITGDCLKVLPTLTGDRFALAVVDPPFNIGYGYDRYADDGPEEHYLRWTGRWMRAVRDVLTPTASLYVCIGDKHAAAVKARLDEDFTFRSWIIWHYTFGVYCDSKWGRGHTHILYYTMDPKVRTWNPDPVRVPSDRQTKYGDKRANPKGRVPSDVWTYSRVCGTFKERTGHPCQMPVSLLERIVLASSNPGDAVLDPMCGSGATLVAAQRHGRRWLGVELSGGYAAAARERLAKESVRLVG
jgi:DNA modification methylase